MIQNAVALLCNLSGDTVLDLEPPYQQGTECLQAACVERKFYFLLLWEKKHFLFCTFAYTSSIFSEGVK